MYHEFSVVDTIKASWHIFKKNFVTIIVFSVIAFILLAIIEGVVFYFTSIEDFWTGMALELVLVFAQSYTTLGLYKLFFTLIDSEYYEFEFRQVLPHIRMIISYITVVLILASLSVSFSILLEHLDDYPVLHDIIEIGGIIVALYLILRIMFFITFIVDDRSGPLESLKQSFELTYGYMLKILAILGIIVLLIAIPALLSYYSAFFSLIIMFTYPFVNIILAETYRKLVYSHKDVDDDVSETL
jgi:hypothetical protein